MRPLRGGGGSGSPFHPITGQVAGSGWLQKRNSASPFQGSKFDALPATIKDRVARHWKENFIDILESKMQPSEEKASIDTFQRFASGGNKSAKEFVTALVEAKAYFDQKPIPISDPKAQPQKDLTLSQKITAGRKERNTLRN